MRLHVLMIIIISACVFCKVSNDIRVHVHVIKHNFRVHTLVPDPGNEVQY